jgi:hypothetical protein
MNLKHLTTATFITTLSLLFPLSLAAQDPPASTYRPGNWQPVARIDTKRPFAITLVNETDITLDYDLTANITPAPQQVSPGKTSVLKGFAVPAYILINPTSSQVVLSASSFNLKYEVNVKEDNTVMVKVRKVSGDTPGDTTLNLQETGAIYIY